LSYGERAATLNIVGSSLGVLFEVDGIHAMKALESLSERSEIVDDFYEELLK
jgi:hypothetical protein